MRWRDDEEREEEHTIASLGILDLNEDPDPVSPTSHLPKALDACLSMACTNDLTSRHMISNILMMLTQLSPGDTNLDASIRAALSILPYHPGSNSQCCFKPHQSFGPYHCCVGEQYC